MARLVKVNTIQPPVTNDTFSNADLMDRGLELLDEAGRDGADIACFPEYYNVFGLGDEEALEAAKQSENLIKRYVSVAQQHRMYLILPVLEYRNGTYYNSSVVMDRRGDIMGRYVKTHLIDFEVDWYHVVAGDTYQVFDLDFGKIGIMTCYDGYFPEVARILTLQGAEIIFYPGWQSGPSEISWEIQIRGRAIDYCVYIARSSFGYEPHVAWQPGMFYGRSFIIGPDGTIISDPGHYVGMGSAVLDLDKPRLMQILDKDSGRGEDVRNLKQLMLRDRRPETYGLITQKLSGASE
jgi:N-carbamoylputrescine amidase